MATLFPLDRLKELTTPLYFYDIALLRQTLTEVATEANRHGFCVHYALKANANGRLLEEIRNAGLGVDCVSGNEVRCALEHGFDSKKIVYAVAELALVKKINLSLDIQRSLRGFFTK